MVDSIYRTRSLGVGAEGLPDQYADGKAAKVWEYYIGCQSTRTEQYRTWISGLLRKRNCTTVLDVACGTGVDSILLVNEGFHVTSTDASDKMLKYALKERWNRRKEQTFDKWVIEEANWLTLVEDMDQITDEKHPKSYDAVVCLGNSFAHLPDFEGTQHNQKQALDNFHKLVKPGGILVIDHRNYDDILRTGKVPPGHLYYNSDHVKDIKCSNLYVNGQPSLVTLDYCLDVTTPSVTKKHFDLTESTQHFRLSYYPHLLDNFSRLLRSSFGEEAPHEVYGDFKLLDKETKPAYYIHVIEKLASKSHN